MAIDNKKKNEKEKNVIVHNHAPSKKAVSKAAPKKLKMEKKETLKEKNGGVVKDKPVHKKMKLERNTIIFFAIIAVVFFLICLKFMGLDMTLITSLGVLIILLCSWILKKLRRIKFLRIVINLFTILGLIGCIAGIGFVIKFGYTIVSEAPEWDIKKLNAKETSILYSSDGKEYAELGTEKREIIQYKESSENIINAIIATEDSRFFQHSGFDALRFFKASLKQASGDSSAGGASTISMQVIKNHFTSKTSSGMAGIKRKFTDIYLSVFKLEQEYGKEQIFEFYINNHFLGANSYGVEQASITYFNKHANELNLSEAALIAGMFQAPGSYNPFTNPDAATNRRREVLNLMEKHGYITKEQRDEADAIPIEDLITQNNQSEENQYQSYIDTVIDELINDWGIDPYTTSLKVYTNIDTTRQKGLDDIFSGKTFKWENSVVQSGIAAVDVWTGKIVAIAGGRSNIARGLNRATNLNKQIGSTAKPVFDYGPGMEYANMSTYTMIDDSKYYYSSGQELRDADRKYLGPITLRKSLALSRNIPALKAFQQTTPQQKIDFVTSLGITPEICPRNYTYNKTIKLCENNNNKNETRAASLHEAHSIGAFNGSNPLEMAAAYAAFANGGYYYKPYTVRKIIYRDTNEEVEYESEGVKVMKDSTAFMITNVLEYAVTDGLSSGAKVNGIHVAAKTGTTNFTTEIAKAHNLPSYAVNDAWIVGYDPDTAVGMWYGYDKIYDGKTGYFLKSATSGFRVNVTTERNRLYQTAGKVLFKSKGKSFKVPSSVVKVGVELGSNPAKLPSANTPTDKIVYEYFRKSTEPTEVSSTYNKLSNVTGLSASYNAAGPSIFLSWTGASKGTDVQDSYGKFGYKVYKDNKYLGFTTNTSYTYNGGTVEGVYKVVTTFENYSDNASSGASVSVTSAQTDTSNYTGELNIGSTTIAIGSQLNSCLTSGTVSPSCAVLYKDGTQVTSGYTVSVSVKDKDGDSVSIDTSFAETYKLTYKITYNGAVRVTKETTVIVQ